MEIKDRFKEGLVFLEEEEQKIRTSTCKEGCACFLCGQFIEYGFYPMVCSDCKKLWGRLKEISNEKGN